MADNKKYYYMRLKDNFFDSEEIVLLESMPDGYLYSNILLKLYLLSLKDEGRLMFKGTIPYSPQMIATITRHQIGTVEKALKILAQMGLIEVLDSGAIYMLNIQSLIGQSSTEADRRRYYYNRIQEEKEKSLPDCEKSHTKSHEKSGEISTPEIRDKRLEIRDYINTEDKSSVSESVPYELVKDAYNSICKSYPKCTVLSDKRKKAIKARFREGYTLEQIKQVFTMAEESEFLKGKNDRNWSATFDWMLNTNNMAKILDGNYSRGEKNGNQSTGRDAGNTKQSCKYGITL